MVGPVAEWLQRRSHKAMIVGSIPTRPIMTRMSYPEPDRWYLPILENIEYSIKNIEKGLRLNSNDPTPNFIAVVKQAEHLYKLIRVAAIQQERKSVGQSIIKWPSEQDS